MQAESQAWLIVDAAIDGECRGRGGGGEEKRLLSPSEFHFFMPLISLQGLKSVAHSSPGR